MESSTDSNEYQSLSAIDFQPSIDNIDDGYGLCEKNSLTLVYSNPTFTKWFNISGLHISISDIISDIKTDILLKRLNKRGTYLYVIELEEKKWCFPQRIEFSFKLLSESDKEYVSIHARDMTKLLEKEAQLFGHTRVIEQSNRKLSVLNEQLQAENTRLSEKLREARK